MTPLVFRILLIVLVLAVAAAAALVPAARERAARLMDRVRQPTPRARRRTAAIVFVAAGAYILGTALLQDRDLFPKFHDEYMHLLQARMLSQGRLWMPPHELGPFFDSFHVLVRPVYASIYFPGTALLYLPTVWLDLPSWAMPLLAAAASAALLYLVVGELVDGVGGLLAALMLVSLQGFRFLALVFMSHGAMVMLGLAIVWTFLRWRRLPSLARAAAMGAAMGWAAIARPFDAIAFAAPVAVALLLALRGAGWRCRTATLATVAAAAAPFVALQVVLNLGVTGSAWVTPYQLYARQDSPGLHVGFDAPAADATLASPLPQKTIFYREFLRREIEKHREQSAGVTLVRERLPLLARSTLPSMLLIGLVAASVGGLRRGGGGGGGGVRWVLWAMLPLYLALYATFPFLLPHYAVVPAPAVLLAAVMGARVVESAAAPRWRAGVAVFLATAITGLSITALPQVDREVIDDGYVRPTMWFVARALPGAVKPPAIVLFRFTPGDNVHEEPVYNVDVADPDAAPIIRAHDLGVRRDRQLFEYYARRQPERSVYLYDRATRTLVPLGNVVDLARRGAAE